MSLTFDLDSIQAEDPYNNNLEKYFPTDKPGFNFNHKLRDFEEFTATRQHFEEFGTYTRHPVNRHQSSKFIKFWKEEKRRSLKGYNIGRDWIPGYYYWYLNYMQIEKVIIKPEDIPKIKRGEKVAVKREEHFPDVWDYDYYWFHYLEEAEDAGQHGSLLKSRGKGYSYKGASMVNRNYFLIPKSKSYVLAHESSYLEGGDGILARAFDQKEFINKNTALRKFSHQKNSAMHYRASKVIKTSSGQSLVSGIKSEVIGVSLMGNIGRARGKRGKLILWEESGNFPGLTEAWQIARESIEQDAGVFGLMVAFGTSGSEQRSFTNLKNMFLKPSAYNIKPVPNIWSEKGKENWVGMFCPSWTNINGFMDKDGNTDRYEANKMEIAKFETLKINRADPSVVTQHKMERPRRPEDALQKKGYNAFPVRALRQRLAELETEHQLIDSRYVGIMGIKDGKVVFLDDPTAEPVEMFPHDNNDDNSGAIIMWEKPVRNSKGDVVSGLYIAGGDPYDHDKSTTMSLGSTWIMNSATGKLVAEYTGRPDKAADYWEQTRLLLLYFNATINHENDKIGFRNHLERKGSTALMIETPQVVRSISANSKVERPYGTHATTLINKHARTRLAEWLKSKVGTDDETIYAHTLESIPLIQELIEWDMDGNFDRISALGMLMIYFEEVMEFDIPGRDLDEEVSELNKEWFEIMEDEDNEYEV